MEGFEDCLLSAFNVMKLRGVSSNVGNFIGEITGKIITDCKLGANRIMGGEGAENMEKGPCLYQTNKYLNEALTIE